MSVITAYLTRPLLLAALLGIASCGGSGGGGTEPEPLIGLDTRPANDSCLAGDRPATATSVAVQEAFPDMPPAAALTKILQAPDEQHRWFYLEQDGRIRTVSTLNPSQVQTWVDMRERTVVNENGGLLSMAFHPGFPAVPQVFVYYTTGVPGALSTRLSRLTVDDVELPATVAEEVLLTVDVPAEIHYGGDLAFGPDGNLYLGLGDTGVIATSQTNTMFLGSMLRIDVTTEPSGYSIPDGNPFAGNAKCGPNSNATECPEIFAWGFRNPWRSSFDADGNLWVGDVGFSRREEINIVTGGNNYGWPCFEGADAAKVWTYVCPLSTVPTPPVYEYDRSAGDSAVTGGYSYQGSAIPALAGKYIFGDFVSGRIWSLEPSGSDYVREELADTDALIVSFAAGNDGEIYFADRFLGRIFKLVGDTGSASENTIAGQLSATGCVAADDPDVAVSGVISYSINAPFWSDGAVKERYLAIPDGTTININGEDDWVFPEGSVLMKSFRRNNRLIETRLLMRHTDGSWAGYTYEWDEAQSDATRVVGGKTTLVEGEPWIFPSEGQCMVCHTAAAGFSLGLETAQLNREHVYAGSAEPLLADQLLTLDHIGMFAAPLPDRAVLPALPDPGGNAPIGERARAWLHSNCAQCHQPDGPTPSSMDLRYSTPLSATKACNAVPQSGDLGIDAALLIAPGAAERSVLLERISRRDSAAMPPLGSAVADNAGISLLTEWINGLQTCTE